MPELSTGYRALDPCVHCGFCLPACPTYLATGDENDSPRGRIVLMKALENGELAPTDPAVRQHLDACLGCRGCEPACPSGVGYGRGIETARRPLATFSSVRFSGSLPVIRAVAVAHASAVDPAEGESTSRAPAGRVTSRRWRGRRGSECSLWVSPRRSALRTA